MLFARCKAGASRGRERGRLALLCEEMGLGRLTSEKMPGSWTHASHILSNPPAAPTAVIITENETSRFVGDFFLPPTSHNIHSLNVLVAQKVFLA